jgi:penicillin-binding protein 1A
MQQSAYTALRNGLLQYTMSRGYNGAEKQITLPSQSNGEEFGEAVEQAFNDISDYGTLKAAIVTNCSNTKVNAILRDGTTITLNDDSLKLIKKFINRGDSAQITRGALIRVVNNNNSWAIVQLPEVEGAIIALNPTNGGIKAMMGGFDFFKNNYNHVTQAMRQPGSGFKSFVYSAALEKNFSPNSIVSGDPICFNDGANGQWCPKNDEDDVTGAVTVREALARSLNIPTVRIISSITPQFVIQHISQFGFDKSQFQPYLTIGLGANEVTPLQLAQAYAVFANGGYVVNPYIINTITDDSGKILAKTAVPEITQESPAIAPRNAFIVNSMLQSAIRNGTGARAYRELKRNDMAGKTGTTSDNKDVWFNGYTPNLVAITWVGFDQPKTLGAHAYGANIALPIWVNFMKPIINQIPQLQLPMPPGIKVISGGAWKGGDEYVYDESYSYSPANNTTNNGTAILNNDENNSTIDGEDSSDNNSLTAPNKDSKSGNKFHNIESLISNLID